MDAENFFSRWSRRKSEARQAIQQQGHAAQESALPAAPDVAAAQKLQHGADDAGPPLPTMDEVASLTPQSDFSRFVARGVDSDVRRAAMKKLFTDPHFNTMDGLDIYIDDYNKFTPLPDAMLAALDHAQGVLNPQPLFDTAPEHLPDESAEQELLAAGETAEPVAAQAGSSEEAPAENEATAQASPFTDPDAAEHAAPADSAKSVLPEQMALIKERPDHADPISRM